MVSYEVFGPGGSANINYLDLDAKPQRIDGGTAVVADPGDQRPLRRHRI